MVVCDGLRPDDPGIVDNGCQQVPGRLRRHEHHAAVAPDHAAVFNQRVDSALVNLDIEQFVTRHI